MISEFTVFTMICVQIANKSKTFFTLSISISSFVGQNLMMLSTWSASIAESSKASTELYQIEEMYQNSEASVEFWKVFGKESWHFRTMI